MRRYLFSFALLSALVLAAPAAAATPAPFGHACTDQNGVRLCPTTDAGPGRTVNGVKTFDGVPLDVDVTLPATGDGPFPTVVMLHGYGGDKTDFESSTPGGKSSTVFHYNNNYFAKQGYAVLNYTVRGFGHSCGGGPTADHTGDCANGYIRLADSRFEARDAQDLIGSLVDEGITKRGAIGVTGISYGGGQSMELAFLRDRIINPDHSFSPWKSPKGKPLSITAAWPRWPWSDLSSSLLPNGRFLDFDNRTAGLSRNPVGVPIQSFVNGLFASGQIAGYYCGNPPATPCNNPDADLPSDFTQVLKGEPATAQTRGILDEITTDKGSFGLSTLSGNAPAPLLIENGWTDDLFPPAEALRIYNLLRARDPHAAVSLQFGDLGHSRGSNKTTVNQAFNTQGADFFAARLLGSGTAPAPAAGSVTAFTQTCPKTSDTPDGGPFSASSWPALHPGAVSFGAGSAQTVLSTGGALDGPAFDPVPQLDPAGTSDACKTVSNQTQPGTAVYTHPVTGSGFTLLGLPTVRANVNTMGPNGQLDARLYDVIPGGTERLISRSAYRLLDNQSGPVTFQLHGNGYKFLAGHTVKLELRGQDPTYYRPSNTPFSVQISSLNVALPVAERPCPKGALRLSVTPSRVTAGQRRRFAFTVNTRRIVCTNGDVRAAALAPLVPVRGALVSFAGHRMRTDARGRVSVVAVLHRPGRYGASASASRLTAARTSVLAVRARRAPHPRFTG